jgi:hypothetical protein
MSDDHKGFTEDTEEGTEDTVFIHFLRSLFEVVNW